MTLIHDLDLNVVQLRYQKWSWAKRYLQTRFDFVLLWPR